MDPLGAEHYAARPMGCATGSGAMTTGRKSSRECTSVGLGVVACSRR